MVLMAELHRGSKKQITVSPYMIDLWFTFPLRQVLAYYTEIRIKSGFLNFLMMVMPKGLKNYIRTHKRKTHNLCRKIKMKLKGISNSTSGLRNASLISGVHDCVYLLLGVQKDTSSCFILLYCAIGFPFSPQH